MLPEIFGLIQCIIGCVIVFKHSQKVVWLMQKMGFAPRCCTYKRSKKRVKMPPELSFWGRKNRFFFWGGGTDPDPSPAPHHVDVSPPPLLKS